MTDRELLELAAKAAGLIIVDEDDDLTLYVISQHDKKNGDEYGERWAPLEDDGDALRLAVACDMTVCADGLATVSACHGCGHDKVMVTQLVCKCGNDKSAATRRAITLAAAEMGRAME